MYNSITAEHHEKIKSIEKKHLLQRKFESNKRTSLTNSLAPSNRIITKNEQQQIQQSQAWKEEVNKAQARREQVRQQQIKQARDQQERARKEFLQQQQARQVQMRQEKEKWEREKQEHAKIMRERQEHLQRENAKREQIKQAQARREQALRREAQVAIAKREQIKQAQARAQRQQAQRQQAQRQLQRISNNNIMMKSLKKTDVRKHAQQKVLAKAQIKQAQQKQEQQKQAQIKQAQQKKAQIKQAQQKKAQEDKLNKIPDKIKHRMICLSNIPLIRNIIIDRFGDHSNIKETILIEFRPLPHLEFLLRNTIIKLNNWNHTIVCGNKNYVMCNKICENIHKGLKNKIKIIKLDIDNLTPSEYSKLLMTKEFWNRFNGDKLLVYQEDTMLFHSNINPFLKYDYVGAPWSSEQDDNSYGVGNGGFSLRTKSKMLECIEKINPTSLKLGKSTLNYMKNTKSTYIPEDVYFSKAMIDNNIGVVAKRNIAREFSQETQKSINPLGGHNFWLADKNIIKKPYVHRYSLGTTYALGKHKNDHRAGWSSIIHNAIKKNTILNSFINTNTVNNNIILIDCMEQIFLFDSNNKTISRPWIGIIHYPVIKEKNLGLLDLDTLISRAKHSLPYCKGLISLSQDTANEIKKRINIKVDIIKHPIETLPIKFSLKNFLKKKTYSVVQLGQQFRKISTIYTIKTPYPKIWVGSNNGHNDLSRELKYIDYKGKLNDVQRTEKLNNSTYDRIITENIVIIPLWNASANNSILECIEMNIPSFVTRLPASEEYLGKDYPMFYTDISVVEKIINNRELLNQKYEETYNYLLNIDKSEITHEHFNSELLKIINL